MVVHTGLKNYGLTLFVDINFSYTDWGAWSHRLSLTFTYHKEVAI